MCSRYVWAAVLVPTERRKAASWGVGALWVRHLSRAHEGLARCQPAWTMLEAIVASERKDDDDASSRGDVRDVAHGGTRAHAARGGAADARAARRLGDRARRRSART